MAQFRGTITGNRGEASRLGSKESGMRTETNGWTGGVTVRAAHYDADHPVAVEHRKTQLEGADKGIDRFEIYATFGSSWSAPKGTTQCDGYLGVVVNGRFTPSDELISRILRDHAPRAAAHEV